MVGPLVQYVRRRHLTSAFIIYNQHTSLNLFTEHATFTIFPSTAKLAEYASISLVGCYKSLYVVIIEGNSYKAMIDK